MYAILEYLFNISEWMHPKHCTPNDFFRVFVILCGTYISLIYLVFAINVFRYPNAVLKHLLNTETARLIPIVFLWCAITHASHSLSYYHQYFKLVLLVGYPVLVHYHTKLLLASKRALDFYKKSL